ncbi:MAG: hypothetical protein DYG83_08265 [Candidatus Brocadia sp. AMX2]|uniref:Uncharacterized protein n=1 Tax=Candidatus Brocadia sinica JPN1 TaxID=1197129 RepID=A0ABQ0JZV3_9BACT|nr:MULTISPECIES: hypothetical protein [Brocadia]KXK25370.1 MAG: hypothetical protein UZ01_03410 [Candidatus Brocadia sinica]MBC6932418.1 hypothetical protein [Candidatus Brocadia sp.]MBL1170709.1 hypothetical protein [Candidatus Brocadia sp. AMX1]NOG42125.1 hypothetical protein [Planctomycetota bacterium]KAA0244830.1 MAG: hypothetical protein EDM70_04930 [Candidatus Brocadia sp. AMX2]
MSAMVISSLDRFISMARKLEAYGVTNIHLCYAKSTDDLDISVIALVPFVDYVILGQDAHYLPYLNQIVKEAQLRHIPVLPEERIVAVKN